MNDLSELYQSLILDHHAKPRNFGTLEPAEHQARGHNPLCGDMLIVTLQLNQPEQNQLQAIRFLGDGCAISRASASLMCERVEGMAVADVVQLYEQVQAIFRGESTPQDISILGKLAALQGVQAFPARVKCATLCWHTLMAALQPTQGATVCTE